MDESSPPRAEKGKREIASRNEFMISTVISALNGVVKCMPGSEGQRVLARLVERGFSSEILSDHDSSYYTAASSVLALYSQILGPAIIQWCQEYTHPAENPVALFDLIHATLTSYLEVEEEDAVEEAKEAGGEDRDDGSEA